MGKQKNTLLTPDIKEYIDISIKKTVEEVKEAVKEAVKPLQKPQNAKTAFKNTEARLYALPVLKIKIKDDIEKIEQLQIHGTPERSKSITRFSKNSVRLDPEEALEAIIKEKVADIATDQHEVDILEKALDFIRDDPYYETVSGRYFDGLDNEEIGEKIGCDGTTVWRNRQRLIKRLAVRLYGTNAID